VFVTDSHDPVASGWSGGVTVVSTGYLLRRAGWAVAALYLVLSATFVLVAGTPDPNEALAAFSAATSGGDAGAAAEAYEAARNLDAPLLGRYVTYMTSLATLQWGMSDSLGRPVTDLVAERLAVSASYVLPSVILAAVLGAALGLYAASSDSRRVDHLVSGVSYAGFGVPNFWLAEVLVAYLTVLFGVSVTYDLAAGLLAPGNLGALTVAVVVLTTTLLAAQLRYVRAETRNYLRESFVKTARAKGVGRWRVVRHAFRNAVLPLVSLLFTELLSVLFVSVFVLEVVLDVPGLGALAYDAIRARDVPLVMGTVLVPVVVGVVGNLAQDVLYTALDPRLEFD
jgi:peptide/nickel transport system permease protein